MIETQAVLVVVSVSIVGRVATVSGEMSYLVNNRSDAPVTDKIHTKCSFPII